MNDRFDFLRAARSPLVLITVGVLFVLDQESGIRFYRTWPLLLIVFGVLKLAERIFAPPPPPGAGGTWGGNPYAGGPGRTPGWPPTPPPASQGGM